MAENKTTIKAGEKSKKAEKASALKTSLIPRATEKTYRAQTENAYAFFVPLESSKQDIAARVEKEFNVTVEDVRVLTRKGKKCRFAKGKHAYPGTAFRRDRKLAYVTLKAGDSIEVFKASEAPKENK
ncbi:50S ribosomal protein L23 [Candidatus Saccharibacteria bacterium]|nr:50S ribosomal protein L23 [Candidatus Saccharibacteria bacterium]